MNGKLRFVISEENPETLNDLIDAYLDRLKELKDFTTFRTCGLVQTVNDLFAKYGSNIAACKSLFKLVGTTSRMKAIQTGYQTNSSIFDAFLTIQGRLEVQCEMVFAMAALVYMNESNQKFFANRLIIKKSIQVVQVNSDNHVLVQRVCSFYSNLSFKSQQGREILYQQGALDLLMRLLQQYIKQNQTQDKVLKQILKAIGNCSSHSKSALRIAKTNYVGCVAIVAKDLQPDRLYLLKCMIDIFSNLSLQGTKCQQILRLLETDGVLPLLYKQMSKYCTNTDFVCSCLDTLIRISSISKALSGDFVQLIVKIIKAQQWNKNVVARSIHCLALISQNKEVMPKMMALGVPLLISQILDRAPDKQVFQKSYRLIRKLFHQEEFGEGMVSCVMSAFMYQTPQEDEMEYLIWILASMNRRTALTSIMLQSLFQPLVICMNKYFKSSEKIVKFGVEILQSVINQLTIEAPNQKEFVEFSYKFLTKTTKLSYVSYETLVKSFLCLLAKTLIKLPILKIQLSNHVFLSILESWLKICSLIDIDNLKESLDLCFFILQGTKKLPLEKLDYQTSLKYLKAKTPCVLYRVDGTSKLAQLQLKQDFRLVCYKQGSREEIKPKYSIPAQNILLITFNFQQNQLVLQRSVFFRSGGIFARVPIISNCVTISGVDKDFSKHINVEFRCHEAKIAFLEHLKNVLHHLEHN